MTDERELDRPAHAKRHARAAKGSGARPRRRLSTGLPRRRLSTGKNERPLLMLKSAKCLVRIGDEWNELNRAIASGHGIQGPKRLCFKQFPLCQQNFHTSLHSCECCCRQQESISFSRACRVRARRALHRVLIPTSLQFVHVSSAHLHKNQSTLTLKVREHKKVVLWMLKSLDGN